MSNTFNIAEIFTGFSAAIDKSKFIKSIPKTVGIKEYEQLLECVIKQSDDKVDTKTIAMRILKGMIEEHDNQQQQSDQVSKDTPTLAKQLFAGKKEVLKGVLNSMYEITDQDAILEWSSFILNSFFVENDNGFVEILDESLANAPTLNVICLLQSLVQLPNYFPKNQEFIVEKIKEVLKPEQNQTAASAAEQSQNNHWITKNTVELLLILLSSQPTAQLRSINPLMLPLVSLLCSDAILATADDSYVDNLDEAIIAQSILFRNHFSTLADSIHSIIKRLDNSSSKSLNSKPCLKGIQAAIKALLLIFDKQKDFILQAHSNSKPISEMLSILFEYLSKESLTEEYIANPLNPLPSCTSGSSLQKTQFVLKQLRDLSKILNVSQVFDEYAQLFGEYLASNIPLKAYAAFIAFSTIGEYKVQPSKLEEFVDAAIGKAKNGTLVEQFGSLNAMSLIFDLIGTSFTQIYEHKLLRACFISTLESSLSEAQRSMIYQALTLFLNNWDGTIQQQDMQKMVRVIKTELSMDVIRETTQSAASSHNSSFSTSTRAQYCCLILLDMLISEKFSGSIKGEETELFRLARGLKSEDKKLCFLRNEVIVSFVHHFPSNHTIKQAIPELVQEVTSISEIDQLEKEAIFEVNASQLNLLAKIIAALALSDNNLLEAKREFLLNNILKSLIPSVNYIVSEKEKREAADEDAGNELTAKEADDLLLDTGACRKAFKAIDTVFKLFPRFASIQSVLETINVKIKNIAVFLGGDFEEMYQSFLFSKQEYCSFGFGNFQAANLVIDRLNDHLHLRDAAVEVLANSFFALKKQTEFDYESNIFEVTLKQSVESLAKSIAVETDHAVAIEFLYIIQKLVCTNIYNYKSSEIIGGILVLVFELCQNPAQEGDPAEKNNGKEDSEWEDQSGGSEGEEDEEHAEDDEDFEDVDEEDKESENKELIAGKKDETVKKTADKNQSKKDTDRGWDEWEEQDRLKQLEMLEIYSPIVVEVFMNNPKIGYGCYHEVIEESVMGLCESEDERFKLVGMNILAQTVNLFSNFEFEKIQDQLGEWYAYFFEGIEAQSYALKQTSVYALGVLVEVIPQAYFKKYNLRIREAILSCIQTKMDEEIPAEQEEEFGLFIDNAIASLGKLIWYKHDFKEAGPFMDLLPLKYDAEEADLTHSNFIEVVKQKAFNVSYNSKIKEALMRIKNSPFTDTDMKTRITQIYKLFTR